MESKSYQSECQLLGSMFLDPEIIPAVKETIPDSGYFGDLQNRIIFGLLINLHAEGIRPDLVIMRNRLEQSQQLKAVGGVDYLVKVVDSTATPANYAIHAKHVRECYLERRLSGLKGAIQQAESKPGTVDTKIEAVRQELENIQNAAINRPADSGDGVGKLIADTIAGKRQVLQSPWPLLDSLTRCLMPGTLTLLCGNPGASKSFMLLQWVSHLLGAGIRPALLELEESTEFHTMRALSQQSGIADLTDPDWIQAHPDESWAAYKENQNFVAFMSAAITAPANQLTFQQVAGWIRDQSRAGCRFVAVDPITAVQTTRRDVWAEHNDFLQQVK
ncbi:MAG TPA: DnaB-like helicase N-terminal domain-containing protein, partial [Anaerohalosphaeraceae bacterium]|nr:DnaB-like helicase N-terminal domain-containing protein [Anaerohalosphaeraceae bacterium]